MLEAFCTNYGNWRHKAIRHVSSDLLDPALIQSLPDSDDFTKVISIEWSASLNCCCLSVSELPLPKLH